MRPKEGKVKQEETFIFLEKLDKRKSEKELKKEHKKREKEEYEKKKRDKLKEKEELERKEKEITMREGDKYRFCETMGQPFEKTSKDEEPVSMKPPMFLTSGLKIWMLENLMLIFTLSGVAFGIALGFALRTLALSEEAKMVIAYPGELFMRLLKLMILPLIISCLIVGSASLNAKMNSKIAVRTMTYFVLTSMLNALLGILLVVTIHPGDPSLKTADAKVVLETREVHILDSLLDLGRNLFPENLFQAMFEQAYTAFVPALVSTNHSEIHMVRAVQYRSGTNTLGIVFFCLVFGTMLGTSGQKGYIVVEFFQVIFEVVMRMVTGVMWFTPIGICSVITGKIVSVDNIGLVMSQLAWFILTVIIGVFLYQLVLMQLIYYLFIRKNPYRFYLGLMEAMLTAAATASTAAALPVTFRCMKDKVNVDSRITRFVLPIGCNINMDGTALFVAVASVFIAQMNNIQLGFGELCTVFLTSTAVSMSSASVPSAALVLIFVILGAVDVPTQDVSLLFAVDWFLDRIRTTNNMLGDCYAAAVVEQLSTVELISVDVEKIRSIPTTITMDEDYQQNRRKLSASQPQSGCHSNIKKMLQTI